MSRAVAIIPARHASTRFPGKVLAEVGGKPLIQHVWERARALQEVEAVLIATDDERIARAVQGFGGEAVLTRPDHPSGTDRIAEVARSLEAGLVVNLQGDEPCFDPKAVDELVGLLAASPELPMGTLGHPITDPAELADPNAVKVVVDPEGHALYFSRAPIPARRDGTVSALRHIGIYVFRRTFLLEFAGWPPTPLEQAEGLEQLRALEHRVPIRVLVTPHPSIGVDTPADLERVRRLLEPR